MSELNEGIFSFQLISKTPDITKSIMSERSEGFCLFSLLKRWRGASASNFQKKEKNLYLCIFIYIFIFMYIYMSLKGT